MPGPRANSHPVSWTLEPWVAPSIGSSFTYEQSPCPNLIRLLRAPPNLTMKVSKDRTSTTFLGNLPAFYNPHCKKLPPYIQSKSTHPPVPPPADLSQHNRTAGDTVPCQWQENLSSALGHHITLQPGTQILGAQPAPAQLCAPGKLLFWGAIANPKLQALPSLLRHYSRHLQSTLGAHYRLAGAHLLQLTAQLQAPSQPASSSLVPC